MSPYTVFYQSPDGFYFCKTSFNEPAEAEGFVKSKLFVDDGAIFHYILKNGSELIKGQHEKVCDKTFLATMKYAVELPANVSFMALYPLLRNR
ncbi:hypothetical protein D0C36_23060 [Mucilaginibacter conchicola]|uniref:Uncharacterized protein n=1 Tax=Mucilaginibacter conchicola TaxID=2303333 RepID=A0A372NPE6_9SPHI|nr:hypothetical protein [Mucilaginibacter conchicola]RFZ90123.1 hypothetical protein D0C36_23060 [Mucilaginibacter conchicola]